MAYLTPSGSKILRSLAGGTAALALRAGHNFGSPPEDPGPPAPQNWYDAVFGMYTGATVVGNRDLSPTAETTWAAATAGVNDDGTTVTITGSQTADGIQFNNRRWIWSGNSGVATDLSGTHQGGNTNSGNWQVNGDDFTMEYFTIDNETSPVNGNPPFYFNATTANGTHTLRYGHIKSAPTDCIKGPNNGTMQLEWMFFDGYYLGASGVHMDLVDMKAASATSYIKDSLFLGNLHPSSPFDASEPSTGMNAAIRCVSGDAHGYDGSGRTYERLIIVGSDDVNATATLLSFTSGTATGVSFYDILVDLREHNSLCAGAVRVEDWKVNAIDWDQCVSDGFITVGADIPFPNLGTQPAAVPSTMLAPVITAVPGGIQWSDNTRPWNQRSLITQYDMRYSTDGSSWTTVTDVSRTTDLISVSDASNYRVQFRAVNGVGPGAWSASSNLVDVVAPSGTHRIAIFYGQSEFDQVILAAADSAPTKPTLAADGRVKFVYNNPNAGDPRPIVEKWLTDADSSVTGSMRAFANTLLHYSGPNDTWEIGFCTYTGLGWNVLFNDGSAKFPFSTVSAVEAALTGVPTRQYQSWLSANRTIGNNYARGFENLWLGTDNGTPITAPHDVKDNGGGTKFTANHLMPEVFDPAVSIPVVGQHKFDPRNDLDSFQTLSSGGTDFTLRDVGRCRDSVETFFAGPNVGTSLRGAELSSYLNGYDNGSGGWTDVPHPGREDEDGNQRFGGHLAYALCESLGLANAQPEITSVTWATDKVTISSSAGAITNVFAARAESQLNPATFPHYTEAMGFYINGQPAERAEIVAGNIELYYGDGTQSFINTDAISFLPGGGSGALKIPEDFQNGVWKAVPCVAIGLPGDGLMNLRPAANLTAEFPNTLVNTVR